MSALPAPIKTWQHSDGNQILAGASAVATNQALWLATFNKLIGFTSNSPVLKYSCNSVTAGAAGDGVNHLTASTNFVWNSPGSIHSWWILQMASGLQICFSCEAVSGSMTVVCSNTAGFTGGSTTARPTATDEYVLQSAGTATSNSIVTMHWTAQLSSDGDCMTLVFSAGGTFASIMFFQQLVSPTTGFTNAFVCGFLSGASAVAGTAGAATVTTGFKARQGTTNGQVAACSLGFSANIYVTDTNVGNVVSTFDSTWPMLPIEFVGVTSGCAGPMGPAVDLWYGSHANASGSQYPPVTLTFAQFGDFIIVWDGSTVVL